MNNTEKKENEIIEEMLERFYVNWSEHKFKEAIKIYFSLFNRKKFSVKKMLKSALKFPLCILLIRMLGFVSRFLPMPDRLVCFFPVYHIGGAERVHADIIKCLKDEKILIFFTERSRDKTFKKEFAKYAHVVNLYGLPYRNHCCFFIFKKAVTNFLNQRQELKILVSNSPFLYYIVNDLRKNFFVADIIHAFGGGIENISLPYVERINRRIIITPASELLLSQQYKDNNIPREFLDRIVVIENKINVPDVFYGKENRAEMKIIFVGRDSLEKRLHILLAAYNKICEENKPIVLNLIGSNFDSVPESVKSRCNIIGPINDYNKMEQYYKDADAIIITSISEGFPMVIMEAMAYGVIPVATAVGGIPYHIKSGDNGVLLTGASEELLICELSEAILELFNNIEERKRLSQAAYKYAYEHFRNREFCASYKKILDL